VRAEFSNRTATKMVHYANGLRMRMNDLRFTIRSRSNSSVKQFAENLRVRDSRRHLGLPRAASDESQGQRMSRAS
jgi:hypothetical protein